MLCTAFEETEPCCNSMYMEHVFSRHLLSDSSMYLWFLSCFLLTCLAPYWLVALWVGLTWRNQNLRFTSTRCQHVAEHSGHSSIARAQCGRERCCKRSSQFQPFAFLLVQAHTVLQVAIAFFIWSITVNFSVGLKMLFLVVEIRTAWTNCSIRDAYLIKITRRLLPLKPICFWQDQGRKLS